MQYLNLPDVNVPAAKQPLALEAAKQAEIAAQAPAYQIQSQPRNDRNRIEKTRERAERAWRGLTDYSRQGLAEAFKQSDTISSLLTQFVKQGMPGFNIVGAFIIKPPADVAAFNLAVRTPYY